MNLADEAAKQLGQPESESLEYKPVLPPPRNIAQLICGFANGKGGLIILGVRENNGSIEVVGLSDDFRVNSVIHKALDLLEPKPGVSYGYFLHGVKNLYAIKVERSVQLVLAEGKAYGRTGVSTKLQVEELNPAKADSIPALKDLISKVTSYRRPATGSLSKLLDHYQSVANIVDDSRKLLFPISPNTVTTVSEGKILARILFSSCVDTFEGYLSDLLYEIFLAKPESLKSDEQVKIKEVLNCADIQEFVIYWSKKKLGKLQRGSVKGFLIDTEQLSSLGVMDQAKIDRIDQIFQIRHLYSHRNGIVDEKFLDIFRGQFALNDQHQLTVLQMVTYVDYLCDTAHIIDSAAINKFLLATV